MIISSWEAYCFILEAVCFWQAWKESGIQDGKGVGELGQSTAKTTAGAFLKSENFLDAHS